MKVFIFLEQYIIAKESNAYLIIPKNEIREICGCIEKYIFNKKNSKNMNNKNFFFIFSIKLIFFTKILTQNSTLIIKQLIFIAALPIIIEIGNKKIAQSKK